MIGGKLCWDKGAWQNRSDKKMQRQQKVCCCRMFLGVVQGWVVFLRGEQKIGKQKLFLGCIFGGRYVFPLLWLFESDGVFLVIGCFLLSFSKEGIEVVYTLRMVGRQSFPFGMAYFRGRTVSFRKGRWYVGDIQVVPIG